MALAVERVRVGSAADRTDVTRSVLLLVAQAAEPA